MNIRAAFDADTRWFIFDLSRNQSGQLIWKFVVSTLKRNWGLLELAGAFKATIKKSMPDEFLPSSEDEPVHITIKKLIFFQDDDHGYYYFPYERAPL